MSGRKREPSFQLASGTTCERDGMYNLKTLGVGVGLISIFLQDGYEQRGCVMRRPIQ